MKTLDFISIDKQNSAKVINGLELLLANVQVAYANIRGFHWNIQGKQFFVLHSKFEDIYDNLNEKADEIAERILTLGGSPSYKYSDYLVKSKISESEFISDGKDALKKILEYYKIFMDMEREVLKSAQQAEDEVTVAIMSDYLKEQEKMVWMLVAYME